jgi:bifunctional oligoribonuclease and PAP phosphatase NrnA
MVDFNLLSQKVKENNSFLISTHVNPDADAIGAEIAFFLILKKLGKKVHIINYNSTPYFLEFLDPEKVILKFDEAKHSTLFEEVDVLVVLDLNSANRLRKIERPFVQSKKLKICIDHHQDAEKFVDYCFNDSSYSATSHIIYDFIKATEIVQLTKDIAIPLYAGIMTDLGSFHFERTTPSVHRIVADLIEAGANPIEIYDKIYDQSNFSKIKLLGETLSSIKMNNSNEVAYMVVTQNSVEQTGADESEVDGFVNYCLSIKGIKIGVLFFELNDGVKISFRSKGTIPVHHLAELFGGGGHINAAGARLFNVNLNAVVEDVLNKTEYFLKNI